MTPDWVSMTAGYSQPGSCTIRPVAWSLKRLSVPCTGAANSSRRQAAATAAGSRTLEGILTMWDTGLGPPGVSEDPAPRHRGPTTQAGPRQHEAGKVGEGSSRLGPGQLFRRRRGFQDALQRGQRVD